MREERHQQKLAKRVTAAQELTPAVTAPVMGCQVISCPCIHKPDKIKDLKKCADELKLGGYAKVGKPGIIVIEGSRIWDGNTRP